MKKNFFLIITIFIFTIFFISAQIISPGYFSYDDNTNFASTYGYNYKVLTEKGKIPVVDFHQYMGQAYLGQGQTGVLFIPAYLAVFLSYMFTNSDLWSVEILVFLFLMLSSISMYFFLIKLECKNYTAMAGAILWITMPFVFSASRSWLIVAYTAFWIPFNFLFLIKLSEKPSVTSWLILAVLRALMIFNGHIHFFHIVFVLELIFLSISAYLKQWFKPKFFISFICSYIVSALLAMAVLLPMYKAATLSDERGLPLTFEKITQYSLTLDSFFKAQLFDFSSWAFQAPAPVFYIGITSLLIPLFLLNKKIRENTKYKLLIIFSLCGAAAFLLSTKLYGYLSFLPTFSMFRWPCKYYIFFVFFISVLIILVWNAAIKSEERFGNLLIPLAVFFSIMINTGLIVYSADILKYGLKYETPIQFYSALSGKEKQRFFTGWVRKSPRYLAPKLMTGFKAMQSDLYHFAGYDPLVSKINVKNSLGLKYMSVYQNPPDELLFQILSEKGVKYIVTENSEENARIAEQYGSLERCYADDDIIILKNQNVMPIVYFSDSPKDAVEFQYGINQITINTPKSGELNISLAPIDGYKIYFNNLPADLKIKAVPYKCGIYETYENIKINIPEEVEKLTIRYEDPYFITGAWISAITLFLSLAVLVVCFIKKRQT